MRVRIGVDGTIVSRQKMPYEQDVNVECKVMPDKLYYVKCDRQVHSAIVQAENVQSSPLNSLVSYPEGQVVVKLANQYNVAVSASFTIDIVFSEDASSKVTLKSFSEVFARLNVSNQAERAERADNVK